MGIDVLRDVKMWESEGFVNVRRISRICECDLLCGAREAVSLDVLWGGGGVRSGL